MNIRDILNSLTSIMQINEANTDTSNPAEKNKRGHKPASDQRAAGRKDPTRTQAGDVENKVQGGEAQDDEAQEVKSSTEKTAGAVKQKGVKRDTARAEANPFSNYEAGSEAEKAANSRINDISSADDKETGANSTSLEDEREYKKKNKKQKDYDDEVRSLRTAIANGREKDKNSPKAEEEDEDPLYISDNTARLIDQLNSVIKAGPEGFGSGTPDKSASGFVKKNKKVMSPEVKSRVKAKDNLAQTNRDSYNELDDEEREFSKAKYTGAQRTIKEIQKMARLGNSPDFPVQSNNINQYVLDAREGDQEASRLLYTKVAGTLAKIARTYAFNDASSYEEIYAEACANMVHAMDTFDINRGVNFNTWLTTMVSGLAKDKVSTSGNVKIDKNAKKKALEFSNIKRRFENDGMRGTDLGLAVIDYYRENGHPSFRWEDYDKLRQLVASGSSESMNATAGNDEEMGEIGDLFSANDSADGNSKAGVGAGASPEDDLDEINKQLATSSPKMKARIFQELANQSNLSQVERDIVYKIFGIGGNELTDELTIMKSLGLKDTAWYRSVDSAFMKMAQFIAEKTGGDVRTEYNYLQKIRKYKKSDMKTATTPINVKGYTNNEVDDDDIDPTANEPKGYEKYREIRKQKQEEAKRKAEAIRAKSKEHQDIRTGGLFD